ncbi:MAG: TIGR03013 family PEP-CTERM/XrtA system glycosyltransferase [Acidobacteria bacterium]|nr:TIGR03013 family PEP-CTERM/XrtA system glycosyltransferase [Acidobacteriota bacterium]
MAFSSQLMMGQRATALVSDPSFLAKALLITFLCQLCLYYADFYDFSAVADVPDTVIRLMGSLGVTSLLLAVLYFWFPTLIPGRGVFVLASGLAIAFVAGWRVGFIWLTSRVGPRERLLIVGTKPGAVALARELIARRLEFGVEIVGFVEPEAGCLACGVPTPGVIGEIDDIPRLVEERKVDRVVVSLADARGKLPMDALLTMKLNGVTFDHLASVYEEYTGKIALENLRPSWLIFSSGFRKPAMFVFSKRALDITAASIGLVLASPLMAIVALAVKLTSKGPVLYHQQRTGLNGRPFTVHKFRTMCQDAEAKTGPTWATAADPRITRVGAFLRKTRLDEVPQLWNVLCGEMSVVGPRPERPEFVRELTEQIPYYGQRHSVKPGVTGWAQVRYTYGASIEDTMEKLQYDLFYIKNASIGLDLFVLFTTVKIVLLRRGAR